jgi:hypothetical protein
MRLKLQLLLVICFVGHLSFAQTTAPDFTSNDCNTATHNLYSELNAGKVVVIEWVMPCTACIGGATAAYNAVQSFALSHPGMVVDYLVDDLGNSSCSTLSTWATANGMDVTKMTIFKNSPITIDQGLYGGNGMPHVVVIAPDKRVLFNQFNEASNDIVGITAAINEALNPTGIKDVNSHRFEIYPNPANNTISFSNNHEIEQVVILDMNGQVQLTVDASKLNKISVSNLPNGNYTIQFYHHDVLISTGKFTKG